MSEILVTQILDRASRVTGLRATGTEREIALQAINDAYHDILTETQIVQYNYTHRFLGAANIYPLYNDVSITTEDIVIPDQLGIIAVVHDNGSNFNVPLKQVSEHEILDLQRGLTVGGNTRVYAMMGTESIRVWPRPAVGDTVTITYVPRPAELVEGATPLKTYSAVWGQANWNQFSWGVVGTTGAVITETYPSMIPNQFRWSVLLPQVVAQCMDKDARVADVSFWLGRYEAGIQKMLSWNNHFGGVPAPVYDGSREGAYGLYPDQYSRGWH